MSLNPLRRYYMRPKRPLDLILAQQLESFLIRHRSALQRRAFKHADYPSLIDWAVKTLRYALRTSLSPVSH